MSVSLSYIAGNSVNIEFTVTNQDGESVDITDDDIRFVMARDDDVIISTDDSTATATAADGGVFNVEIADEHTSLLKGTYRFQAELEDSAGAKATVARGFITFAENLLVSAS